MNYIDSAGSFLTENHHPTANLDKGLGWWSKSSLKVSFKLFICSSFILNAEGIQHKAS